MKPNSFRIIIASLLVSAFSIYSFNLYMHLPSKNIYHENADNGKILWQKYNCNACHQIYGLGGYLGPDLTNIYSKKGKEYINAFLISGTSVMPDFHLQKSERENIITFLASVDSSGSSDPSFLKPTLYGTAEPRQ